MFQTPSNIQRVYFSWKVCEVSQHHLANKGINSGVKKHHYFKIFGRLIMQAFLRLARQRYDSKHTVLFDYIRTFTFVNKRHRRLWEELISFCAVEITIAFSWTMKDIV